MHTQHLSPFWHMHAHGTSTSHSCCTDMYLSASATTTTTPTWQKPGYNSSKLSDYPPLLVQVVVIPTLKNNLLHEPPIIIDPLTLKTRQVNVQCCLFPPGQYHSHISTKLGHTAVTLVTTTTDAISIHCPHMYFASRSQTPLLQLEAQLSHHGLLAHITQHFSFFFFFMLLCFMGCL